MAQDEVLDDIQKAIDGADPYRRQGTAYLHTRDDRNHDDPRAENPTGAVVVPISVATTFEQRDPGVATAKGDPNSFGAGYEYSRTGMFVLNNHCILMTRFFVLTPLVTHLVRRKSHERSV